MEDVMKFSKQLKGSLSLAFQACQFIFNAGYSVVSNERGFSTMKLRSTMSTDRLDNLMILKVEKDLTDTVDMSNLIKRWALLKNRRIQLVK